MAEHSTPPVIDFEKLKQRTAKRIRTPDFVSIYSSSANIETSFNDLELFFGQIVEATTESLVLEERIAIILTPEQAKSVLRALQTSIESYETLYGPIRNPPNEPS